MELNIYDLSNYADLVFSDIKNLSFSVFKYFIPVFFMLLFINLSINFLKDV